VWFATSNDHKFKEVSVVLKEFGIPMGRLPSKGLEVQSDDPSVVAARAADEAYQTFRKPLFVEDTGFFIDALGGFPGTTASYVYKTIGLDGVLRLMEGSKARGARFEGAIAYCDGLAPPRTFVGMLKGRLALKRSGEGGFGYDPIFVPDGGVRTLAEMTLAEKCEVSHRTKAVRGLGKWLEKNPRLG